MAEANALPPAPRSALEVEHARRLVARVILLDAAARLRPIGLRAIGVLQLSAKLHVATPVNGRPGEYTVVLPLQLRSQA